MKEVISIIGPKYSGKDVAGEYLSEKLDIPVFQINSGISHEVGDDSLLRQILDDSPESRIIVTGMRRLGQIALLDEEARLFLLSIDATSEIRYERLQRDGLCGGIKKLEEFKQKESIENNPINPSWLYGCMQRADFEIINNDGLYYFQKKLDQVMDLANEKFIK